MASTVLDSERAKQKPLVDPQIFRQSDELQQNIKMGIASEPQIFVSEVKNLKSTSVSLNSQFYDLKKAAHPAVCVATFAFKMAAFLIYLLIGNFISSILTFILVLLLSVIDFWIVKNVSGRLLIGLRWKSEYDINGKQVWKFQSYNHNYSSNAVDRLFFWASQLIFTLLWTIFLLLNLLTLDLFWALLLFITSGLCAVNLYGYYQCRGEHKKKIQGLKKEYGKKVFQSITNPVL